LAAKNYNLCVVGDDAQSIYGFRGANIQNILNFQKDYPDVKVFKLEQNYRSTQNIVNVANSIISNNKNQLDKNVFSENDEGEKVTESIVQERTNLALNWSNFAILYRTNAQSRSMEEALRKLNIPYKIYGGQSFYQRKEIKDLVAYFRLTFNNSDEEALKRVINYPGRGIGDTTVDRIIVSANQHHLTLWDVITEPGKYVDGRSSTAVGNFAMMIQSFQVITQNHNAYDAALHIAQHSG